MKKFILFTAVTAALGIAVGFLVKPGKSIKSVVATAHRAAVSQPVSVSGVSERGGASAYLNGLGMKFVAVWDANVGFASHEVTRSQFAQFAANKGLTFPAPAPDEFLHPANNVSWEEAVQFCQWLSEREGLTYRLPTDFEWSLASGLIGEATDWPPSRRISQAPRLFYWGELWPPAQPAENLADQSLKQSGHSGNCFSFDDGFARTSPVGSFPPNERGLYDLGGNVREWVHDWFEDREGQKTIRGASFLSDAADEKLFLKGYRSAVSPGHRDEATGFRVVVELDNRSRPLFIADQLAAASPDPLPASVAAAKPLPADDDHAPTLQQSKTPKLQNGSPPSHASENSEKSESSEKGVDVAKQRYRIIYKGKDGVNIRSQSSFDDGEIDAVIMPQKEAYFARIGDPVEDGDVEWARIEIKGWIPVKVGKSNFLESIGDQKWKVTWNKAGDRYVAMRSETDSESTMIAKINHGAEIEELDSQSEGNRDYIYARYEGWAVIKNKAATYLEPVE